MRGLRHGGCARCLGTVVTLLSRKYAGVIQLVECQLPKLDVAGSSPVARSFRKRNPAASRIPFLVVVKSPGTGIVQRLEAALRLPRQVMGPCALASSIKSPRIIAKTMPNVAVLSRHGCPSH